MAIAIATARISDEELDELAEIVVAMQQAADMNDLALLADLDFQFHHRIVKAAGHNRLYQTWSMLASHYWALYLTTLQRIGPATPAYLGGVYGKHMPSRCVARSQRRPGDDVSASQHSGWTQPSDA